MTYSAHTIYSFMQFIYLEFVTRDSSTSPLFDYKVLGFKIRWTCYSKPCNSTCLVIAVEFNPTQGPYWGQHQFTGKSLKKSFKKLISFFLPQLKKVHSSLVLYLMNSGIFFNYFMNYLYKFGLCKSKCFIFSNSLHN